MVISEQELQASLSKTQQRREQAREMRRRQLLRIGLAGLVVLVVVGATTMGLMAGANSTAPPAILAITWPHGETEDQLGAQHVVDGSTVLVKPGQPLRVALPEPGKWEAHWTTADVTNGGDNFDWTPANNNASLKVKLRAHLSGWKKIFAWRWPSREITLHGVTGKTAPSTPAAGFLREIEAPASGVWLHYRVLAKGANLRFDDRAVKALGTAAEQVSAAVADGQTADSPVWQLIPAFNNDTPIAGDIGTYAILSTENPVADARQAFQTLDQLVPGATIKVIVQEGAPGEARFRIAFDDKGQRFVWVKKAGEDRAEPQNWLRR